MNDQTLNQAMPLTDRWLRIRERFLQDALPVRLGEFSSSLSEAKHIADPGGHEKVAIHFIDVVAHYLNWGFPDADSTLQADLADLQQLIARLREDWQAIWESPAKRTAIGASFDEWSQKMLDRSGLLDYDDWRVVFRPTPASAATSAGGQGTL